ncbi:indolepyruvate ferredoxin oxidoreductase family protein [Ferribacterium limneticum]|uniref:indolepyruvate ferredoxin oxidoreductase family protein n=1 Tax=Ferribacterium limneticum TaxID=76259 RepID=UPI001CF9C460|nr:indolepyruvate ferredoxin oxidoreductase family protein [Ferribacterium limneticum]UCV28799.1 indolepyruvate ferredoxin oxidoreductase family protein [Ferribacterium limneticum]UCV32716.1 indolepyruvate ferredoxin oxidoreductase family protein [Ferribacterium limneticum]
MSNLALPASLTATLDDKYTRTSGRVFLTGTQALIRLPMLQRERDLAAGLNTAGFISGYRGSPLGNLDLGLWKAKQHLAEHHITFQPGLNEDMAATAVWGSQQVNLFPGAQYDGVFGLWYGKGPGVDRCGDVFRHANAAGSSKFGGVLVIAGDDHAAKSSTLPHQTEHVFKALMMPVLYPANVQEYLDFGLHGWAMSRYSGCWVAFKALADTVETSASVNIDPAAVTPIFPPDFKLPPDGLNIRWPDPPLVQEARLLNHKLYAALAYCRANGLNKLIIDSPTPKLGILTAGKSYLDVRQALVELGIDDALAAEIGIRLYKVGMVWPLEPEGVRQFAEGLEEILVVEEKRQLLEYQLKEELYNWTDSQNRDVRPRVIGKFDEIGEWSEGNWLLPAAGELPVATIARVIAERIGRFFTSPTIAARLKVIADKQKAAQTPIVLAERKPHFCSGCPHNSSTKVPEGSRAVAGIGCHYMVTWMDRSTSTFTHMGGEGVPWVGQAPFTSEKHIFANLGDGTYFHSGLLAIRQSIAAKVPITYKILYNDAVAMTGGQPVDGILSVARITRQLEAEGIEKMVIVAAEPEKYLSGTVIPANAGIQCRPWIPGQAGNDGKIPVAHRDDLDAVQRELREYPGVSILIYDQVCATEARRRRKRGKMPPINQRVFINEAVCEGCGDCSVQSNCLSVVPVETAFGTKRQIDQSSCNQDFSCLKGFCPSFVTIEGGKPKKGNTAQPGTLDAEGWPILPAPTLPATTQPYNLLITGVGGMGVITLGALIGMAAHLDGKGISTLDMTGLAQKYGAVFSHLRIADRPEDIHAARIATGEAHAILGGDLVVSAGSEALSKMLEGRTRAVVSCTDTPTADFTRNRDWHFPLAGLQKSLTETLGSTAVDFIDAQHLATRLMGDALYANMLLLGVAWQKGLVPVSAASLDRAIELNGAAVAANREAFQWGRRVAADPEKVASIAGPLGGQPFVEQTLDELIASRVAHLTAYQDAALAQRYTDRLAGIRALGDEALTRTVATQYARLLAPKDEFEVARLYADSDFIRRLRDSFDGDFRLQFHLAPPLLAKPGPDGRPKKIRFGPWLMPALKLLAKARRLRHTWLNPFRFSAEFRVDRQLLADYEADLNFIIAHRPSPELTALANWPAEVRGFGLVRSEAARKAASRREALRQLA